EDGIRDDLVTGVQTCALPISALRDKAARPGRARRRAGGAPWGGGGARSGGPQPSRYGPRKGPAFYRIEQTPQDVALELERRHGQIGRASCRESVRRRVWSV